MEPLTSTCDLWHSTSMSLRPPTLARRLFPFHVVHVELALASCAFALGSLAYSGVEASVLAWGGPALLLLVYLIGLVVHRVGDPRGHLQFVLDGALRGLGYERFFRLARKSLLLMHVDEDEPSEELQLLYGRLLDRGVQVRRLVFFRRPGRADAYAWIARFGAHPNLRHRVIDGPGSRVMPLSLALVDESIVLVAVPGFHVVDTEPFAERLVFRHLLALRHPDVVRAFLEMYEKLWESAEPAEPSSFVGR